MDELGAFLRIFNGVEFEGIKSNKLNDEAFLEICQHWKKSGVLTLQDGFYRIEKSTQLAIMTIIDYESYFSCNVKKQKTEEITNIYMHGETIILTEKEAESQEYNIYWIPFLSLAIGAISNMLRFLPKEQEEIKVYDLKELSLGQMEDYKVKVIGKRNEIEEYIGILYDMENKYIMINNEEEKNNYKVVTRESFLREIINWLALSHRESLRGEVKNERV